MTGINLFSLPPVIQLIQIPESHFKITLIMLTVPSFCFLKEEKKAMTIRYRKNIPFLYHIMAHFFIEIKSGAKATAQMRGGFCPVIFSGRLIFVRSAC